MRKRIALLAMQAFLLFALLAGTTNAWFVSEASPDAVSMKAARINAELQFSLNGKRGIPGEKIILSQNNKITDKGSTRNYIYKITYTLSEASPEALINALSLSGEGLDKLKVSYDSTNRILTVYGINKVEDGGGKNITLPALAAEFNKLKNPSQAKGFTISAKLQYCQNTKEAANNVLGIDGTLFTEINRLGGGSND